MKYIKTYEEKPPFIKPDLKLKFDKLKGTKSASFDLSSIILDCEKYNLKAQDLIEEIFLNKTITFQCWNCYNKDLNWFFSFSHNIMGICKNIKFEGFDDGMPATDINDYNDYYDIYFYIEDAYHTIHHDKKIKVFNYEPGPYMEELEAKKNADKYNL